MLEELDFTVPEFGEIRDRLLSVMVEGDLMAGLARALGQDPEALLARFPRAAKHPYARPRADLDPVRAEIVDIARRHQTRLAFEAEMQDAARDIADATGEDWTHRVRAVGEMPQSVDMAALKQAVPEAPTRSGALARMRADMAAGAYRRKKPRQPPSNQ